MSATETRSGRLSMLFRSTTFRNTGWSALGSVTNGLIGAVSSAILARVLGVGDFGTYTLLLALLNLVTDLSDLGLNSAMVKFGSQSAGTGEKRGFAQVASAVFRMKLMLGLGVVLLALVLVGPLTSLLFAHVDPGIGSYFRLSLIGAAVAVPATFFPALLQTMQSFRLYSIAMVSRYASKLGLLILFIVFAVSWSLELIVWVEIASIVVFLFAGYMLSPVKRFDLRKSDPALRKGIVGFGKWIVLYQVIALVGGKTDVLFVGGISDAAALGLYGAAMKIAGVVSVSTYSYFNALLPEFSSLSTAQELSARRRSSFGIGLLLIGGIALLALIADPLVALFFGDPFASAGRLLQIVCIGLALNVMTHPLSAVLFSQNKPMVFPVSSGVSIVVFAAGNFVLIPLLGVTGAAVAYVLQCVALFLVTLFFYLRWKRAQKPHV